MVGPDAVRNAVSLNSVQVNVARAVGPAVAGVMIATVGVGVCFLVNAASFVAVVASLMTMDRAALLPTPPARRAAGQLREGLRYALSVPEIAVPLAMMGLVGALAYEFQVSLPAMAHDALHSGAEGFGFMTAAMGAGAICGGLVVAARGRTGLRPVTISASAFAVAIALAAAAPDMGVELVALGIVGAASVSFMSIGNSTLQLAADPAMRGRVMALWFVALQGSTPIGGPAIGGIIELAGPRTGLLTGAAACAVAAALGLAVARRRAAAAGISGRGGPETLLAFPITGTVRPGKATGATDGRGDDRTAQMADPRGAGAEPAGGRARLEHPQRRAAAALGAEAEGPRDDAGRAGVGVNAYTLAFAGLLFTWGVLGDRIGRKTMLLAGMAAFGGFSALSAFSQSPGELIAARALMGVGAAAVMPATLSIITNVFEAGERAKAIAIWAGAVGIAIAAGPVLGGLLLAHFWWGSVFLVNVPICVVAVALMVAWVPNSRDPDPGRLDPIGVGLSLAGIVALVYGVIRGADGWGDGGVWLAVGAGVVLLAAFVAWERRAPSPVLDLSLFRIPQFSAALALTFLAFCAMTGEFFVLAFYLQSARGLSPLQAGLSVVPIAAGQLAFASRSPRLVARFGTNRVTAAGMALMSASYAFFVVAHAGTPTWVLELFLLVQGVGMACVMPATTATIMASIRARSPASDRRSATPCARSPARSASPSSARSSPRCTARASSRRCARSRRWRTARPCCTASRARSPPRRPTPRRSAAASARGSRPRQ